MSELASPGFSDSSGGSDLMALLDQALQTDPEAGEQDDVTSVAYMCAEDATYCRRSRYCHD